MQQQHITADGRCTIHLLPDHKRNHSVQELVRQGLPVMPKSLSPILFYDAEGSRLFEQICQLPEYYLTRTEQAILDQYAHEIIAALPLKPRIIELGSGNSAKTRTLLTAMLNNNHAPIYTPIDISENALRNAAITLAQEYPNLPIEAIAADYDTGMDHLARNGSAVKVFVFLGSNIGNFARGEAVEFLRHMRRSMSPGDLILLGADMVKDPAVLHAAYNDSQGITAAFNRNILARLNTELEGNFVLDRFRHVARWDAENEAMRIYLESTVEQVVHLAAMDLTIRFEAGETIHTESSHKYTPDSLAQLAAAAGLEMARTWIDEQGWFTLNLLRPQNL